MVGYCSEVTEAVDHNGLVRRRRSRYLYVNEPGFKQGSLGVDEISAGVLVQDTIYKLIIFEPTRYDLFQVGLYPGKNVKFVQSSS